MARWRYRLRLVRPRDELSQAEARRCGLLQGEPTTQASAQPTRNSGQSRSFATSWRLEPTIAIGRSNEFKCKLQACIITISSSSIISIANHQHQVQERGCNITTTCSAHQHHYHESTYRITIFLTTTSSLSICNISIPYHIDIDIDNSWRKPTE